MRAESAACEPRSEMGFSTAEIDAYLEGIRYEHSLPIYWHDWEFRASPMVALVPPYLEAAFQEFVHRRSGFPVCPHALLVRDFGPLEDVSHALWWREFYDVADVEEAKKCRRNWKSISRVNELEEHREIALWCRGCGERDYRLCDMSKSFNRGPLPQRAFDMWLWGPFYSNPHDFPSLACLVNLARMKQMLWRRYHFFYDVATLQEVYPENELARRVLLAWDNEEIALPEWRDLELSYEALNSSFTKTWPRHYRSFQEERLVQLRRANWRESVVRSNSGLLPFNPCLDRRIYVGEELPRSLVAEDDEKLEDNVSRWAKRRVPIQENRKALEMSSATSKTESKVSQMNAIVRQFCCFLS